MNWDAIGAISEVVGVVTVVVSLIYVAIQIRQNSASIQMAAETDLSKHYADWASLVVNNPDIARIWDAAADDPESLTDEDIRIFLWFAFELLLLCEAQYHMYLQGHMTEDIWNAKSNMFLGFINNPIISKWWATGLGPFTTEFREYVEQNRDSASISWKYASVANAGRLDT